MLLLETAANRLTLADGVLGDDRMEYLEVSGDAGIAAVRTATDDFGADVVIVACSSDKAQEQAMEMAAPRARVLFFGGLPKGTTHMRFPSNILHYQEVQVHGSYASRYRDQVQALDMLARDEGGIRGVVSEVDLARGGARGVRPHPRGRGAEGRRRAMTAVGQVVEELRTAIVDGTRAPGERLPSEPDLARTLGISRPTLRDACARSRTRASCGACTARAPTSRAGRCCATTSSATPASPT